MNQPEKQFMKQIIQFAQLYKWRVAHFSPGLVAGGRYITCGMGQYQGFPDLLLVRGKVIIAAEIKDTDGMMDKEQVDWMDALNRAGVHIRLWMPADWNEIMETLK